MKKTLNANYDISGSDWKKIILVIISAAFGIFVLIFSVLKGIDNSQNIRIDPIPNINKLSRKVIRINSTSESFEFDVYIADTEESRTTGLMNVKSLADDEGMLFIFPDSSFRSFWMKNTYVPLDMLFFDENKKFINMHENATPLNESKRYISEKPAMYVLEVKTGAVKNIEFSPETTFEIIE